MSPLVVALLACAAATLVHHVHNAEFLDAYPNMPAWLSPMGVYAAWLAAASVGLIGFLALRRGYRFIGSTLLVGYAVYALDGLAHYLLAPVSAHTLAMNLTIGLEALAGSALIVAVFRR